MHNMNERRPSVNRPEAGLTLLPRDRLLRLRAQYLELQRTLDASPAATYVHGILVQIDQQLRQGELA
jgi:hypothetical protein